MLNLTELMLNCTCQGLNSYPNQNFKKAKFKQKMSDYNSPDKSGSKNDDDQNDSRISYDDDGSECNITSDDLD